MFLESLRWNLLRVSPLEKGRHMPQSIPSASGRTSSGHVSSDRVSSGRASLGAGWEQLYTSAVLELDEGRLPERVAVARRAILDRVEEILTTVRTDEHRALSDALRFLLLLEEVVGRESKHPHAA
jgi:hypothetical protein